MKKQIMIASLMALALLVSPMSSLNPMLRVNAEEEPAAEVHSVTGNASGTEGTTEKVQLNAPYGLKWGDMSVISSFPSAKYTIQWVDGEPEKEGGFNWEIEVYKDGEPYFSQTQPRHTFSTDQYHGRFRDQLSESGTYKFRVRAVAASGDEIYRDSEWSNWSEDITYVRPEQELGVVSGYWDEEKTGLFHFKPLDIPESLSGNVEYFVRLYGQRQGDRLKQSSIEASSCQGSAVVDVDFSDAISQNGGDKYYVTVEAWSRNIDVIPYGEEGPKSDILDTTSNADNSVQSGETSSLGNLEGGIAAAAPGATVKVTRDENISTLSNSVMQQLVKRGDVALEMEYTYEGVDYHVIIPAGGAVDNEIPWYGPLYLAAHYSVVNTGSSGDSIPAYTVQQGDTMGKIARSHNTTVARLAAANPQIKNVNRIAAGQIINID